MIIRSVTPPVDSDGDGMPDFWEIKYGLNPQDPSDAAKDCNNNGVTNLNEYKAGLDPCDATPPEVVSAAGTGTFDAMKLTFSEPLDLTEATNAANYTISPSLAVAAATYKNKVVTLTTARQTPATTYTIALKGLKDLSKNEIPAGRCLDINYERLGLLHGGMFEEVTRDTGIKESEISKMCVVCPNQPLKEAGNPASQASETRGQS